jgi:hypothetical protein
VRARERAHAPQQTTFTANHCLFRTRTHHVSLEKSEHAVTAITCRVRVVADKVENVCLDLYFQVEAMNCTGINDQFEVCARHSVNSLRDGARECSRTALA